MLSILCRDSPESESVILNASTGQQPIKFIYSHFAEFELRFSALETRFACASILREHAHFGLVLMVCIAFLLASCTRKTPYAAAHIHVTMRQFAIEPKVMHVKQGQSVVLDVSTADVPHGFMVAKLGINEPVQPGKPAAIPLDTSRKGDFEITCSIICGAGHDDMRAEIIVQ